MTAQVKSYALASIFALAAGTWFMSPSSTQACTRDNCKSPVRLLSPGATIPGDLLYFEVLVDDPGVLSLHTKDGEAIAASVRMIGDRRVFAPTTTVPAGTTVVLKYQCTANPTGAPASQSWEYTAGPAIGVPKLKQPELTFVDQTTSGEWVSANLRYLEPVPESASHLMYTEITVDGMELSRLSPGNVPGVLMFAVSVNCVGTRPGTDDCGTLSSVLPGPHEVSVRTTVVGVEKQPDVTTLSIELDCPAATDRADAGKQPTDVGVLLADGGTPPTDLGALDADSGSPSTDAGALIADGVLRTDVAAVRADGGAVATEGPHASGGDGCAVRAPGASSGLSWTALLAGVALVLRIRQDRRKNRA